MSDVITANHILSVLCTRQQPETAIIPAAPGSDSCIIDQTAHSYRCLYSNHVQGDKIMAKHPLSNDFSLVKSLGPCYNSILTRHVKVKGDALLSNCFILSFGLHSSGHCTLCTGIRGLQNASSALL